MLPTALVTIKQPSLSTRPLSIESNLMITNKMVDQSQLSNFLANHHFNFWYANNIAYNISNHQVAFLINTTH